MSRKLLSAAVLLACVGGAGAVSAADVGTTTVGGKGYFDLTNIDQTSDGVKTNPSGTGIDVKRFYISVSHKFDEIWGTNITTDFNYSKADGETQLFVKKAYVEGKFDKAFTVRLGSADLPWVPFVEGLYGYRYVENVLIEHAGFATSADWGLHALGEFADGKVTYQVSTINGNGYKNPTRSQTLDYAGRIAVVPVDGLTLAAGFRTGHRGLDTVGVDTLHTAQKYELLAAYVKPKYRIGTDYFQAKNWNEVLSPQTDKADGYSLWGSYKLSAKTAVFARYDDVKPSKDLQPGLKDTYYNFGVQITPVKGVDVAFVYKQDKVENGIWKTTNGTLGGANSGKHNEIGIWAQTAF